MDSITPQVVFEIYGIKITNTVVSTWVIMVILILLAWVIRRFKPGIGEVIIESINGIIGSVMPEETGTIKYLPILGTLAVFLIFPIYLASFQAWFPPLQILIQPLPWH